MSFLSRAKANTFLFNPNQSCRLLVCSRFTVNIASIWIKINAICPKYITVQCRVFVPAYGMCFIHVNANKSFRVSQEFKHRSGLNQRFYIIDPLFPALIGKQKPIVRKGKSVQKSFWPGGKVFCSLLVITSGQKIGHSFQRRIHLQIIPGNGDYFIGSIGNGA